MKLFYKHFHELLQVLIALSTFTNYSYK